MDDELELEVSDLRTGRTVRKSFDSQPEVRATQGHIPETIADEETSPRIEPLDPTRAPALSPSGALLSRRARGSAVVALTLLVCAGILLSLPGPQASLRQALAGPTPTPTATLAPGSDIVYFEQTAPWGRLTLDGKPLLLDQQNGQGSTLPAGRHTLAYEAAPWPPLRCQISVPAQRGDTCPINVGVMYNNLPASRAVDLGATPAKLPDAQRAALTSAVADAFQANRETADLQPGDHYLGADGTPAVATAPMRATLTLTLNTDPARVASGVPFQCVSFCDMGGGGGGIDWWGIFTHVIVRWQFTTPDGSVIQPGASADQDIGYEVGAQWADGTWKATLSPYYPGGPGQVCWPTLQRAFPTGNPLPNATNTSAMSSQGQSDAEGCVEVVSPGNGGGGVYGPNANATPTPLPAGAAIFIARCGVVLAGNDAAHTAQPQLPLASAHERALATQWLARQPG